MHLKKRKLTFNEWKAIKDREAKVREQSDAAPEPPPWNVKVQPKKNETEKKEPRLSLPNKETVPKKPDPASPVKPNSTTGIEPEKNSTDSRMTFSQWMEMKKKEFQREKAVEMHQKKVEAQKERKKKLASERAVGEWMIRRKYRVLAKMYPNLSEEQLQLKLIQDLSEDQLRKELIDKLFHN